MIDVTSALITLREAVGDLEHYITDQFAQGKGDDPADGWIAYDETIADLNHEVAQAAGIYLFHLDQGKVTDV